MQPKGNFATAAHALEHRKIKSTVHALQVRVNNLAKAVAHLMEKASFRAEGATQDNSEHTSGFHSENGYALCLLSRCKHCHDLKESEWYKSVAIPMISQGLMIEFVDKFPDYLNVRYAPSLFKIDKGRVAEVERSEWPELRL